MVHNEDEWIERLLKDLSKYTNEFYVNFNEPSDKVLDTVKAHPNLKGYCFTTNKNNRWDQGLQRDNTIRLLDDVKPDIVLFPDADETYPKNLLEQLEKFWEEKEKNTFWFRLMYLWGDEKHFRNDGIYKTIHHVRIYKWKPNITYLPYCGYACPTTFCGEPREKKFNSDTPILHWGYMKDITRNQKYQRNDNDYIKDKEFKKQVDKNMLIKDLPQELIY